MNKIKCDYMYDKKIINKISFFILFIAASSLNYLLGSENTNGSLLEGIDNTSVLRIGALGLGLSMIHLSRMGELSLTIEEVSMLSADIVVGSILATKALLVFLDPGEYAIKSAVLAGLSIGIGFSAYSAIQKERNTLPVIVRPSLVPSLVDAKSELERASSTP